MAIELGIMQTVINMVKKDDKSKTRHKGNENKGMQKNHLAGSRMGTQTADLKGENNREV